jgi:hypothetical protein
MRPRPRAGLERNCREVAPVNNEKAGLAFGWEGGKGGGISASPLNDDTTYSMLSGSIRTWEIRPTLMLGQTPRY